MIYVECKPDVILVKSLSFQERKFYTWVEKLSFVGVWRSEGGARELWTKIL